MKKFLILSAVLVFLGGLLTATVWTCCYLNKDVHNGSGVPAWDLKMAFKGDRTVIGHYDGYPDDWHFKDFSWWKAGGNTYLRWFTPVDANGDTVPIPFCDTVHVGYRLNSPARLIEVWWTDAAGDRIPTGHVQQPSHWVYYSDWNERTVSLKLVNDFEGIQGESEPCPDPTIISNIYYTIAEQLIPLDSLNARNAWLSANLMPLPGGAGPDSLFSVGENVVFPIPEPMEPGQVLVYRLEGTGVSGFIDFGQHEMEAGSAIPSLTNWGLIILVALLVASAVFVFFRRKRVTVSP